ncbi:MAG: hypothetical protein KA758_02740 [Acidimicrobiales bacterium]|nr:hypothetical protein [Acidimicrobiales bacterium]
MSRLPVNNSAYHDSAARAKQDAWAALGAIVAGREAHKLTDATHGVLAAEAVLAIEASVAVATESGLEPDVARRVVGDGTLNALLASGPDDTWSGRGNDARRVVFDARREWVRQEMARQAVARTTQERLVPEDWKSETGGMHGVDDY